MSIKAEHIPTMTQQLYFYQKCTHVNQKLPQETLSSSPPGSVSYLLGFLFRWAYSIGWQGGPVAVLGLQDPYSQKIQ